MCPMAHPGWPSPNWLCHQFGARRVADRVALPSPGSASPCSTRSRPVGAVPLGVLMTRSIGKHPDGVPLPWSHVAAAMMSRVGCCPLHGGNRLCPDPAPRAGLKAPVIHYRRLLSGESRLRPGSLSTASVLACPDRDRGAAHRCRRRLVPEPATQPGEIYLIFDAFLHVRSSLEDTRKRRRGSEGPRLYR